MALLRRVIAPSSDSGRPWQPRPMKIARRHPVRRRVPVALLCLVLPGVLVAADPKPEIERPDATPQADGQIHTLRTLPEACARFEGRFTGNPADPYQLRVVRTDANCQARARLLDVAEARPGVEAGWILYDRVRIPSAACRQQVAVLDLWRKPGKDNTPKRDAQGRVRVYLQDAMANAEASRAALPQFSVRMGVEGAPCR